MLEEVYRCVHCGFCLTTCPTYLATGLESHSPRGRLYLIKAVLEKRAPTDGDLLKALDTCVYCLRCETACPSGVKYGEIYEEFLKKYPQTRKLSMAKTAAAFRLLNSEIGLRAAPVLKAAVPEIRPFVKSDVSPLVGRVYKAKNKRGEVALFVSKRCIAWRWRRPVVEAALRVLTWNGYDVYVPDFHCCGAPYRHSGDFRQAQKLADANKSIIDSLGDMPLLVPNSGGCQAELLKYAKTQDILQFLSEAGLRGELGPVELKLAIQHSCHMANIAKTHSHVAAVLSKIPKLHLAPLPSADICCGGGNAYPLRHREIAHEILEKKKKELQELQPDGVLISSPSCLQQLAKTGLPTYFPIEILDLSYQKGKNPKYGELHSYKLK